MQEITVVESNLGEFKTRSKIYGDGRDRRDDGTYGKHKSFTRFAKSKLFGRYEFKLEYGKYKFGEINFEVSPTNFSFSASTTSKDYSFKSLKNKKLSDLSNTKDSVIFDSFKNALKQKGFDVEKIILKEVVVESPRVSLQANVGSGKLGGSANAQLSALNMIIETPAGDLLGVKLKAGIGVGANIESTYTQKGKPGIEKEKSVSLGAWEFYIIPNTKGEINQNSTHKKSSIKESEKRATKFVARIEQKKKGEPKDSNPADRKAPAIASKYNTEEIALMDEAIDHIAENFSGNKEVEKLHAEYKASEDKPKAFNKFEKDFGKSLIQENKIEDYIKAGTETSIFLTQVASLTKNKNLARFANGLSAAIQTFSGLNEVGKALNVVSSASSIAGGLTLATSFLTGAGLVIGGISALACIMGDSGNDGLSDALQEIHTAIIGMWSEMHDSFQHTWERLDVIDEKLTEMERNNWERFAHLMEAIDFSYNQIDIKLVKIENNISTGFIDLKTFLSSYLDYIVDDKAKSTIEILKKIENEAEFLSIFKENTTNLKDWLTSVSALTSRTDELMKSHSEFTISQTALIEKLSNLIAPERTYERDRLNYPLGLFVSLAKYIHPQIFGPLNVKVINPQDWDKVFTVYSELIKAGKGKILDAPKDVQQNYLSDINEIEQVINDTLSILDTIASSSELWSSLVNKYRLEFLTVLSAIEQQKIVINQPLQSYPDLNLSLVETAQQNLHRFAGLSNHIELAKTITSNISWIGVNGTRREDLCIAGLCRGDQRKIPPGELGLVLNQAMLDALLLRGATMIRFEEVKKSIFFAIPYAYRIAHPSIMYFPRNIGGEPTRYWDFTVNICPSIRIDGHGEYPFTQVNLFRHPGSGPEDDFGNINNYIKVDSVWLYYPDDHRGDDRFYSYFYDRFEFVNNAHLLSASFEEKILLPARKTSVKTYDTPDKLEKLVANLEQAYLQLVAFIQLLDPTFAPKRRADAINRTKNQILAILNSGSAESLKNLFDSLVGNSKPGAIWQEELWGYMGENLRNFSSDDIRKKLMSKLQSHPLYKAMKSAKEKVSAIKKELDPAKNRALIQKKLKEAENYVIEQQAVLESISLSQTKSLASIAKMDGDDTELISLVTANDDLTEYLLEITEQVDFINSKDSDDNKENKDDIKKHLYSSEYKLNLDDYESTLQRLCATQNINIQAIEAELIKLERENTPHVFNQIINNGESNKKPLHIAIQASRPDMVAVLLEYDARIDSKTYEFLKNCINEDALREIQTLLKFYEYIQIQSIEENFAMGRTIGLIRQAINQLLLYKNLENADIFLGKTGAGKSTLINYLLGVLYELRKDKKTGKKYLEPINNINEQANTSFLTHSETAFPHILKNNNGNFVDMPGFRDTRGEPWEITAGLSAKMLNNSFNTLRTLVVVFTESDLYDSRIEGIRDSLEMLGKIIENKPELMNNVILLINKADEDTISNNQATVLIENRLNEILEQNSNDFPASTKFILSYINISQIFVADMSTATFREKFLEKIKTLHAKPFKNFNFNCFHRNAEKFKMLISRLENYYQQTYEEIQALRGAISHQHQMLLQQHKATLVNKSFVETVELPFLLPEFSQQKVILEHIVSYHKILREDLIVNLDKHIIYLQKHFPLNVSTTIIAAEDIIEEALNRQNRLSIINSFFSKISPVLKELNLAQAILTNIPEKSLCDENGVCYLPQVSHGNEYTSSTAADNDYQSSAWPFPGANGLPIVIKGFSATSSANDLKPFYASSLTYLFKQFESMSQYFTMVNLSTITSAPINKTIMSVNSSIVPWGSVPKASCTTKEKPMVASCRLTAINDIQALYCDGNRFVFAKGTHNDGMIIYQEEMKHISNINYSDRYIYDNCRPIVWYGKGAMYCEGENTTLIHQPPALIYDQMVSNVIQYMDSQIMFLSAIAYLTKEIYIKVKSSSTDKPLATSGYTLAQLQNFTKQLDNIEEHIKRVNSPFIQSLGWINDGLEQLRYQIKESKRKKKIFAEELTDLSEDIIYFTKQVNEQIEKFFDIPGLIYQSVPSDTHSLYHAISYYLSNDEQAYFDEREINERWSDNTELKAFMRLLNRPIVIIGFDKKIKNSEDVKQFTGEPIFVYYNGNNHYAALVLQNGFTSKSVIKNIQSLPHNVRAPEVTQPLTSFGIFASSNRANTSFPDVKSDISRKGYVCT